MEEQKKETLEQEEKGMQQEAETPEESKIDEAAGESVEAETAAETEEEESAGTQEEAEEASESEEAQAEEPGDDADGDEAKEDKASVSGKKGFFSRRKEKKDKRDTQIEELTDRVKRQMAEFDNYRKRTEKEKAAMFEIGARSVIEKVLPVVDNFERGLASAENSEDPYVQGMEKVYKQLMSVLDGLDVKPIDAVGKEFDPNFHNAVMHVEDEEVGENIVVEELQKGYLYRGSVVRYSMVKVAN